MIDYTTILNQSIFIGLIFLITLTIGSILLFIIWNKKYNIKCRICYETNSADKIKDVKAKYDKQKDKIIVRENLTKYFTLPLPPKDAIKTHYKGGDMIEITITPDGKKQYIIKKLEEGEKTYETLNSKDKTFYLHELEKRNERKKKSLGELIMFLAPYLILIIILGMLLGFWGTVMEPFEIRMKNAENFELKMMEHITQQQSQLNEILQQEQIIRSTTIKNVTIPD